MKKTIETHELKRCLFIGAIIAALAVFSFASVVSAAQPTAVTEFATYFSDTTMFLNGAINPENALTNVWFEWGPTTSLEFKTPIKVISTSGSVIVRHSDYVANLISKKTYYFRIAAQNTNGTAYGSTLSFVAGTNGQSGIAQSINTTTGTNNNSSEITAAPLITTNFPASLGHASATFAGLANAQGSNTQVWFEFGRTQAFGATVGHQAIGNSTVAIKFEHPLINLQQNTTYYYRAVAQNSGGTVYGNIVSFATTNEVSATLPKVETKTISVTHQNVAVLPASINPNGAFTHAWFEWGVDEKLGNASEKSPRGDGNVLQDFLFVLSGLEPETKYFYRVAAENSKGRVYGDALYFTTKAMPKPAALPVLTGNASPNIKPKLPPAPPQSVITENKGPLLTLSGKIEPSNPKAGDGILYSLSYKNESSAPLFDLNIKAVLPLEVDLVASSPSVNNSKANTYNFRLGVIQPGESGNVAIETKAGSVEDKTALIFSGTAEYLTAKAEFKTVTVFTGVTVGGGETFSFAAFIGSFDSGIRLFFLLAAFIIAGFFAVRSYIKQHRLVKTKPSIIPEPPFSLPVQK